MSIKIKTWSEASGGDLHQFIELLGDENLNEVFYPAPDANPNLTGIFALGYPDHRTHPLHPDYKPKPRFSTGYGLLTTSVELPPEPIDLENEKRQQEARVYAHWQKIKPHSVYRLLEADDNFKQARETFNNKQLMENPGLYVHPFAEFRFLEMVVSNVGFFMITDGRAFDWPTPDKKATKKARGYVWKVLDSFDKDGIKMQGDFSKQSTLKSLLSELSTQLEIQCNTGHAAWGGKNRPYRVLIQSLARRLNQHFGEVSPKIVISLAAMVDCPFDERTIINQLKAHRVRQAA